MLKYNYIKTCEASPEQYDVFDNDKNQVAYIRLRHGCLRVDIPDIGGETIFEYYYPDDTKGCFNDADERNCAIYFLDYIIRSYYEK